MVTRRTLLAGSAAAATAALTGTPAAAAARPATGPLILAGGGLADDNAAVYGEIVRRAGGAGAYIGVLTAASVPPSQDPDAGTPDASNSAANGEFYRRLLLSYGAGRVEWIPVDLDHVGAADDPQLAARVATMTGFFFGGGDQFRYVTCMMHGAAHTDSAVLAAIRRRHRAGAVIAGSSAGADIQQGHDMVTGGDSYPALRDGSTAGYFDDSSVSGYWPAGGFGFFTSALLDTHFNAYGRLGRGIVLARTVGRHHLVGVDPDTAYLVEHPGTAHECGQVIGTGGVNVIDLYRDVRWSFLTAGYHYQPGTGRITPPPAVRPLRADPAHRGVPDNNDIFGDHQQLNLALALTAADTRRAVGYTAQSDPRFAVTLTKGHDFRGYTRDGRTADSFLDLTVAISAVPA
ncbi:cyanophycinase domain protein [Actinoplanes sp. SE50]|uniref:cyanophycinase n=1 Tax=unclassified Actinoplanes TaxID=2626549 RepID=UPI00023EC625|nr:MULTISPECIES: cyanophycinase [unclassified Actinoplanes]AEV84681.1 cyanophycinase domain protein [Actinoplanes sp. SE50/110]ATO83073.1 cyanophycinase domain protein [Actinoplanes sp. SE50]SLM00480.1 cyanophycinase [Actinoplanes sp. SE50/110]